MEVTGRENHGDQPQQPIDGSTSRDHAPKQFPTRTSEERYHHGDHHPDLQEQSRPIPIPPHPLMGQFYSGHPQPHPAPEIMDQHMSTTHSMTPMAMGYPRCYPGYYPGYYDGQHLQPNLHGWNHLPHSGQYDRSQGYYPRVTHQTAHHQYYSLQQIGAAAFPHYPPEYIQILQQQQYGPGHYAHAQSNQDVHQNQTAGIQESASASKPHTQGTSMVQSRQASIVSPAKVEEPNNMIVTLRRDGLNSANVPQPQKPEVPDLRGVIFAFNELARKNREQEEKIKTLTFKLENSDEREENLQTKIHELEEKVEILQLELELSGCGEQEASTNVSKTRDLLEENKFLRLEQLELTVKFQMQKMWETIILDMKSRSEKKVKMVSKDCKDDLTSVTQPTIGVEFQKETNPLLIPKFMNIIFESLPLSCLFKCRLVCKLWNEILVVKIIQNGNNRSLLCTDDSLAGLRRYIDGKERNTTMEAGRLEYSTCTKILHYRGHEVSELKKVMKMCAQNLECLSLWSGLGGLYEEEEPKLSFPKLKNIAFLSGYDGNCSMLIYDRMKDIDFYSTRGMCNPSEEFLIDIFEASPKLQSLSCRLYGSVILEALTKTNSYSKLTSLCLKSRVTIPQLRSLISTEMRLKVLRLEGLCVTIYDESYDYDRYDETGALPDDPEVMEFAPLLLDFLKSQANTLEYLKLGLFTERMDHPDIPIDVLLDHFPRMPNLCTFVISTGDGKWDFPFRTSTITELFPKLKNLEYIASHGINYREVYDDDIHAFEHMEASEGFPVNYPFRPFPLSPSGSASISLKNIRGVQITRDMPQFFPFITELHLKGNIGFLHHIPFCLPRLKHFYHVVNIDIDKEDEVLKLIRMLNSFMTGISPAECESVEKEHAESHGFEHLSEVQFARSRCSIFDMNYLETLDFKFSCYEFMNACESLRILAAVEVLISWGLSRMTHLKKLHFQYEQIRQRQKRKKLISYSGSKPPDSLDTLLIAFGDRMEYHYHGYTYLGEPENVRENSWNFELNLEHHTSDWGRFKFFSEDPDDLD